LSPPKFDLRAILTAFVAALLVAGCATGDQAAATATPPNSLLAKGELPVLKVGATADEIIRLVGKPLQIAAMPSPNGKAETWTYRRILDQQTTQVAEASRGPAVIEPAHGIVSAGTEMAETEYHTVYVTTYQVTSLLMFNGKLAASKQRIEKTQSLND
jgi:outer membrane protein assembly factor BamE (lipoprotein component of BamABCDE complex)